MSIDTKKYRFMFSVGTKLAYKIAKRYYGSVHYVWCAVDFDNAEQPPTSNPLTIAKRLMSIVIGGDRHATEIDSNKAGILNGANAKYEEKVIDVNQLNEIKQLVALADYEAFFPVLYVIDTKKVSARSIEVDITNRASDRSIEYKVVDLSENEFQLIDFFSLVGEFVDVEDRRAGV